MVALAAQQIPTLFMVFGLTASDAKLSHGPGSYGKSDFI